LNEHTFSPDVLIAGTHFWNNLSKREQAWLKEAVDNSIAYQRQLWAEAEAEALEEVKKAGVEIITPNKEPFVKRAEKVYEQYNNEKELYGIIQQIQTMQ
jgi:TRAP-type C4-dicarboxylate transport system substrate-binding protein